MPTALGKKHQVRGRMIPVQAALPASRGNGKQAFLSMKMQALPIGLAKNIPFLTHGSGEQDAEPCGSIPRRRLEKAVDFVPSTKDNLLFLHQQND